MDAIKVTLKTESINNLTELIRMGVMNCIRSFQEYTPDAEELEDLIRELALCGRIEAQRGKSEDPGASETIHLAEEDIKELLYRIEGETYDVIRADEGIDNFRWIIDITDTYRALGEALKINVDRKE